MPKLSAIPVVAPVHRALVWSIQRSGVLSERLFHLYDAIWRRTGRLQRATTRFGAVIDCDLVDRIPKFVFHFGHWEPDISYRISRRLRSGGVFVDVGSNLGYYALLASRIVGPAGAVVAIEASPRIFKQLTATIGENRCTNVRAVNIAVAASPGHVTIYAGPSENSGATSTLRDWREGKPEAEVAALPLDQILTAEELQRVQLIKIDVEGAEAPILRQLAAAIHRYPRDTEIIVECNPADNAPLWQDILAAFFKAGFHAFGIRNDYSAAWYLQWRRPAPLCRLSSLPPGQTDVLFTRRDLPEP